MKRVRPRKLTGVLVLKPPAKLSLDPTARVVFLAGSIEMGAAEDWQTALTTALGDRDLVVLNPRRAEWDASWRQSIDFTVGAQAPNPQFREQVEWELDGLDRADVIAMWFAEPTKSPITLLELGLHAKGGKLIIGCPPGFWRRGNIEVMSARYRIPLHATWDAFRDAVLTACA